MGSAGKEKVKVPEQRCVLDTAVLLHQAVSRSSRHRAVELSCWWWEVGGHQYSSEMSFGPAVVWSPHPMAAGAHHWHSWCIFSLTGSNAQPSLEWTEMWPGSNWLQKDVPSPQDKVDAVAVGKGLCSGEATDHAECYCFLWPSASH